MINRFQRFLVIGALAVIAGAYFVLTAPAAPVAQASVPCTAAPWGTPGCEAHLGAAVRVDLRDRNTYLPTVTDTQLGLIVSDLCLHSAVRPELRSFPVMAAFPVLREVYGRRCG